MTNTQNAAILKDLKAGKKLTSLKAWLDYGSCYLPARIGDIRKQGYVVDSKFIKVKTSDGIKHVKQYFIA